MRSDQCDARETLEREEKARDDARRCCEMCDTRTEGLTALERVREEAWKGGFDEAFELESAHRRKAETEAVEAIHDLTAKNERLRAKVTRLENRGIEDMRHSIKAAVAVLSDRKTYNPKCSNCRELILERASVVKALNGGEDV